MCYAHPDPNPSPHPSPNQVRVCYANLSLEKTREAASRLRAGLTELVAGGVDYTSGDKF